MPRSIKKLRTLVGRIQRCAPLAIVAAAIVVCAAASASADTACKPASPAP